MQIQFDPALRDEATAVAAMLIGLGYAQEVGTVTIHVPQVTAQQIVTIGAGGSGSLPTTAGGSAAEESDGNQERSAADVFGGAAPLSDALVAAGAIPLATAPAGLPGFSTLPGSTGLAQTEHEADASTGSAAGTFVNGVELDKQGIPWHHEIHASTKSKTKGGEWTKLRGMNDEAKYNRIVAELKALQALPLAAASGTALTEPAGSSQPASAPPASVQLPGSLPPLLPALTSQPPAAPTVPTDFDSLMPRLTAAIAAGTVPEDVLAKACTARQLPGVVALIQRPDFVPTIWADIVAAYPALV